MKVVTKKLSELRHPEKNIRLHSDTQIKEFVRSIEMFGQVRPIVIDEQGVILCGNGLFDALNVMGKDNADCYVVQGLSSAQKKKLMLADNKIYTLGVDDISAFDEFIYELKDDLDIPGYDSALLKNLVIDVGDANELLSGYGLISEENKADMLNAATRLENELAKETEDLPAVIADENEGAVKNAAPNFVLCPKCGEQIWL